MQREFVEPAGLQRIDTTILPDVRAVAPVLAEFETVDMRGAPVLERKDQFMAGAIEGPYAAVALDPDDQVLELRVVGASRQHLAHAPPVQADEVDRAVRAVGDKIAEDRR
jgi:hypothetical protein